MGSVHLSGTLNFSSLEIRLDMTNFIPCLTLIFFGSTKISASQSNVIERNVVQELRVLSKDQNTKGTCIPLLHLLVLMPIVSFTDKIRSVWEF